MEPFERIFEFIFQKEIIGPIVVVTVGLFLIKII